MERSKPDRVAEANALLRKYAISSAEVPLVSATEVKRRVDEGESVVLIDVRTKAEQDTSMLPGAVSQEDFEQEFSASPQNFSGALLVPYCTIGFRSGLYANKLEQRVQQLERQDPDFSASVANSEGVVMWSHEVGEFWARDAEGAEPKVVKRLHVYGKEWDVAAEGFETSTFGLWGSLRGLWRVVVNWVKPL